MNDYIEALRNLADWLEQNELLEGMTIQAEGGGYDPSLTIHAHGESAEAMKGLGGDWRERSSGTAVWHDRTPGLLGFAEVTVFQ